MSTTSSQPNGFVRLWHRIVREPVLLLTTAILVLQTEAFQEFSWVTPVIGVLGVLARQFTSPSNEVEGIVVEAFQGGLNEGHRLGEVDTLLKVLEHDQALDVSPPALSPEEVLVLDEDDAADAEDADSEADPPLDV